jgi:uncharacterized protein (DUF2267 family)
LLGGIEIAHQRQKKLPTLVSRNASEEEQPMKTAPTRLYKIKTIKPRRKTSHDVFDATLQKTQIWMNEVMSELGWEDQPHKAYMALRTVLHALRDRLTVEEAIQLGAQLPMLIRGFYYEGWTLKGKPHKERHKEDFLDHIKDAFKDDVTVHPQHVCRAVFRVLSRHTSQGEIEDIKHLLPKALKELWP